MKIAAIIQARMGSTRLLGKVLRMLGDKTVLAHVVDRLRAVPQVDEVIVATTAGSRDEPVAEEARRIGAACFRGSEEDVLSRYYEAAKQVQADAVVRITSDCPLLDPEVSSLVIRSYMEAPMCDYASNTLVRTYPRGLDTEIFSFESLEAAFAETREAYDREHVTPFIYRHPERFVCKSVTSGIPVPDYRWTLDTPEDWELIRRLYDALYVPGQRFSWHQAAAWMNANPEFHAINAHIRQKT
ncbi:glycosyltransferase family protein [Paenibacillus humicola]|uniref:glycosyltransferase family protein n=1 Tax=Paenibacillus humicola TaxID=3110540 RepID=UPI00237B8D7C|nr:glycosyltransferase family protein [Paenibacillus humicola]